MKKISSVLIIVVLLMMVFVNDSVSASTIPTISIQAVTEDEKVTILTNNFPTNKEFVARMGLLGTKGVNGILVGTVNSKTGGSLKFTFEIPAALQSQASIAIRLDSTTGGYYSYNWFTNVTFGNHTGGVPAEDVPLTPAVTIVSAKKDTNVTVQGLDFPADETFSVLMGKDGTNGVGGVVVGSVKAGEDESFVEIYEIPVSLYGEAKLIIRFESEDSDLVTFKRFENVTGASGGIPTDTDGYSGIPTFSILAVKEDQEVTLQTNNFPKNKEFKVLMGKMWTKGIGGVQVATFNSGDGGKFTKTFEVPESLKGQYQISIRLQTSDGYYYAYNWFYNNTTNGTSTSKPSGYTGIPTFSITGVKKDSTVTIKTNNFPADVDFKVLMGKMGTKGVNGVYVETINSGEGGVFSSTFNVPASLAGQSQIAIRLEATSGGFYAFNWFYNVTYP